jgi:chlorobactene glucosyltransferase
MELMFYFIRDVYFSVIVVLGFYFFILAASNIFQMRRTTLPASIQDGPVVSILVPMRNEEANIERCISSLQNQDYGNYEILVIDDNSTDNSLAIVQDLSRKDKRIRIFRGRTLPDTWFGKSYALQQLSGEARGDILLFTDADTVHGPRSVSWAVANITRSGADFISGYVGQQLLTFGERVTVPLVFFLTGFVIPLWMNGLSKLDFFAAAIGQYIAVRRDVFTGIGGFEPVKKKTSEDIFLARHIKKQGFKTMFLDISDHVQCRMYTGYWAAVEGIGKNIFDFLGKSTPMLFLIALLIFFFLFFPFPLLLLSMASGSIYTVNLLATTIFYTLTWLIVFIDRKITWYYAFAWPLMFINLVYMAYRSWFKTVSGQGFSWKGRIVT